MTNRISEDLSIPRQIGQSPQPAFEELRNQAQKEFARRQRQIEALVQEHPVAGLGAAICIGILLGWFSKRR